ncbi:hypothetical protein BTHE68_06850 [Burkholderia sp. THE68]|jgi:hypothetical protein|uniref:hypothetical protein n=1 Tax=Burkholderiaceae TaxID=119060 RepID=UPI001318B2A0|nr:MULTISPECIES: hypothetical protein [Burkholderiaceae]BBU26951.1 hypothetical protein BTHE68_06850 [Burkholderia sp. THE68]BCQ22640.1 hypothetical protein NK8_07560 [Caballeronia sp. NK8]
MKHVARLYRIALAVTLASLGPLAHAKSIDAQLDCKSTAHDFVAPLQREGLLETKPMRVEPNSVNAFKPVKGATLTAYGFKVYVVVAYQKDDPIFRPGKGEPIADSAYGTVVWGGDKEVEQQVRAAGSDADVHHVAPFITAIFCKQ